MLTCIACSKQLGGSLRHEAGDDEGVTGTAGTRRAPKALTAQIREMALKASGAYRHCKPCSGTAAHAQNAGYAESDAASESGRYDPYRRAAGSSGVGSGPWSAPGTAALGREIEARLRALSSNNVTPSVSRRREGDMMFEEEEEEEEREWVAQVEPGVLITFVSLPRGRNDLRRIRFSREMFNRWQAQRWWAENCDKVMELYNVLRFRREAFPLPTPLRSDDDDDESSKLESPGGSPDTPPLHNERLPRSLRRPPAPGCGTPGYYSSSDSLDHHPLRRHAGRRLPDSGRRLTPTPNVSSLSVARVEASSADASARTSYSRRSGELQPPASAFDGGEEEEREWVEEDEPGVYVTVRALPGGGRELRRVRFSRERFGEVRARLWWEQNRARIHERYL